MTERTNFTEEELLTIEAANEISLTNLEQVLLTHTAMFEEITRDLPELRQKTAQAKQEVDVIKADLSLSIRADAAKTGRKTTEAGIEAEILLSADYQDAYNAYLAARMAQDKIERARDVMAARENAIKGLITLYVSQYWSLSGTESLPKAAPAEGNGGYKRRA